MVDCTVRKFTKIKAPRPVWGFLLGLALILTVGLSACNKADTKASTQMVSLSVWGSAQEAAVLKTLLSQFEQQNPAIRVKLLHVPDNYYQKLHLLIAGGMAPDVMMMNSINFPVYAAHGVFLDLSPYSDSKTFYPRALEAFYWKDNSGKTQKMILGALPRDISNLVVFYNRALFKQAGLPDPQAGWTWQDFLKTANRLTVDKNHDGQPEQFGISFYTKPPLFWLPFVWSAGGDVLDASFEQVTLNTPEALAGLEFYQSLRNQHHVAPRQIESGGVTMSQLFLQQKLAMLVSGRWSVPVFREQAEFDWDVVPLPVGPSGQSKVGIDASGYSVSATSKNQKGAILLARFLVSEAAVKAVAESGLIVPARPDVAESPAFMSPNQLPRHSDYFISVIAAGVPTHTPPRWNELSEELMLALQPVWDGKQSAKAAVEAVLPRLQPILKVDGSEHEIQ